MKKIIDKEKIIKLAENYYKPVCEIIETQCFGSGSAKTSHDIARAVGIEVAGKRVVQMIVKRMNNNGIPVISFDGSETPERYRGFFIPKDIRELNKFSAKFLQQAKSLESKAIEIEDIYHNYEGVCECNL